MFPSNSWKNYFRFIVFKSKFKSKFWTVVLSVPLKTRFWNYPPRRCLKFCFWEINTNTLWRNGFVWPKWEIWLVKLIQIFFHVPMNLSYRFCASLNKTLIKSLIFCASLGLGNDNNRISVLTGMFLKPLFWPQNEYFHQKHNISLDQ